MKRSLYLTLALAGLLCWAGHFAVSTAHAGAHTRRMHSARTAFLGVHRRPSWPPAHNLPWSKAIRVRSTGDYTVRLKMPDGYRIEPHWHPLRENVTVISGTFKVGMGDQFDKSKMGDFPAGSFAYLDPDMHHYAMASGEVVVQVHGKAPLQFNYVNPNDDPSRKK